VHSCNLDVLGSDAPLEPVSFVILPRENIQFIPDNDARNVSTRSHPWIAAVMSLIPISFMSQRVFKGGQMVADPKEYRFNSEK
jgi:hypothetical protein